MPRVFFDVTTRRFAAQAIKTMTEVGGKPVKILKQRPPVHRRRHEARRLRITARALFPAAY